jgi:hypothetical protein
MRIKIEIESTRPAANPNIVIVGLSGAAVKESRDRVTTAIANSGYFWPCGTQPQIISHWPILKKEDQLRFTDCA